uniref:Uncharacterized protein n=1 Tax=Arundo donax TaxID=35708 RepID=A0A0A8YYV7_ARUDO
MYQIMQWNTSIHSLLYSFYSSHVISVSTPLGNFGHEQHKNRALGASTEDDVLRLCILLAVRMPPTEEEKEQGNIAATNSEERTEMESTVAVFLVIPLTTTQGPWEVAEHFFLC